MDSPFDYPTTPKQKDDAQRLLDLLAALDLSTLTPAVATGMQAPHGLHPYRLQALSRVQV